jgi:hypothetical protein
MNDFIRVELVSARQALHDGAIRKIGPLGLTCGIWAPAIVRLSQIEAQRDQTVATTVRTRSQSPSIVPSKRGAFRTVAYRERSAAPRVMINRPLPASCPGHTAVRKKADHSSLETRHGGHTYDRPRRTARSARF